MHITHSVTYFKQKPKDSIQITTSKTFNMETITDITEIDKSSYRRLVVEYGIVGKNNGKRYPSIVLDGNKWGEDFDYLIDGRLRMQYFHDYGESPVDGEPTEYNQLFMLTTMSDEEILAIYI